MWKSIFKHICREPIALLAIIITIIITTLQSEFFNNIISPKVEVKTVYADNPDGRCSLIAFSIDNNTKKRSDDIRITLVTDPLVNRDRASFAIYSRKHALIGPEESSPIDYRVSLPVEYYFSDEVLSIPTLFPEEYIDMFVAWEYPSASARKSMANEERHKLTPRIATASSAEGSLVIEDSGECKRLANN